MKAGHWADKYILLLSRLNMDKQDPAKSYKIQEEYMTVTEFMKHHSELSKYTANQISIVLNKLGYESQRKKVNGKATRMKLLLKEECD